MDRTTVINLALRSIAAVPIADPDEDSEGARQAKDIFSQVVRSEVERYPWTFARTMASLPASVTAPAFRYARQFPVPSDFLRLVELEDRWVFNDIRYPTTQPEVLYEIHGRAILTDLAAPLKIIYTRDVTNEISLWPPTFIDAVGYALAMRLAMPLTKDPRMVTMSDNLYQQAVSRARKNNAIQLPPRPVRDASWLLSRRRS